VSSRSKIPHENRHSWSIDHIPSELDQTPIRYATFHPDHIEPRRYLIFLNGRGEWIEKYDFLPHSLQLPPGCGFLTWDHRGQGGSGGTSGHVASYEHFIADARTVISRVVGERPYAIVAHSMGGLIALLGTLSQSFQPLFLALSSPLLQLPNHPIPRILSKPLSHFLCRSQLQELPTGVRSTNRQSFHDNPLTHDAKAFHRILQSPLQTESPTVGWIKATFHATTEVMRPEKLQNLRVPTVVICGSNEDVIDYHGFPRWIAKAKKYGDGRLELMKIPKARHEILNEIPRYRNQAIRKIIDLAEETRFYHVRPIKQASSN
jgi:lysophospholipase